MRNYIIVKGKSSGANVAFTKAFLKNIMVVTTVFIRPKASSPGPRT